MTRSPCKEVSNMELKATKQRNMGVAMEISCGTTDTTKLKRGESLQEAFKKFRKNRQREIRLSKQVDENILKSRADPMLMDQLRTKFVERCKHYFGVPYAKKYQNPGTQDFHSPLFLDCCGLIRKVLRDLRKDFGFEIGPWNQAYMFDTLPKDIQSTEDMKPGDLVFISGIYYNKKSKKQRHNMVHVEVWAGDGEKTIGARWQKGKVQYHDSYKFAAKSYHSMQYHFKSIDTWLMGICKSHCKEHSWKKSTYKPGKKSIFTVDQPSEMEDQNAEPEDQTDNQPASDIVACQKSVRHVVDKKHIKTRDDVDHVRRRKVNQVNLSRQTDAREECGLVVESMIRRSGVLLDYYQTNERTQNGSGFTENEMNPDILQSRAFYDLEECVHWLVSSVTFNIANEEATVAVDGPTRVESPGKLATNSNSFYPSSEERIVSSDNLLDEKPQSSSCSPKIDGILCVCPQCHQIEMHCIHQESAANKNNSKDEAEVEIRLEDSSELSSSLECFDFIFAGECEWHPDTVADGIVQCPSRPNQNCQHKSKRSVSPSKTTRNRKAGDGSFGSSGDSGGDNEKNNKKDSSYKNTRDGAKSVDRLSTRQPGFYIGGGNGNWMIEATLTSLGWRKIDDKMDESFKLKWVECKSQINYDSFREGEQIVNHISNMNLLTTKLGLLCSLQEYERVKEKVGKVGSKFGLPLNEFVPETYKLMGRSETLKFVNDVYKDGETWICKPTGMNQGKGIYLVSSREQLIEKLNIHGTEDTGVRRSRLRPPQGRIIQRYVMNPLLLNGYKFDIRAYMLIASTTPYVVLYHPGYVRLSCVPYTPYTNGEVGLHAHLTNQYVQKKHPMYSSMKEETVWSFDRLQTFIDEQYAKDKGLPENWVFSTFTKRMHQIMLTCFHSVRQKLHRRTGTFDLLGFDFLIDEDFKVWLLEVNINPALHTNCQVLMDLLPGVVDETLKIVIEICDKTKRKLPVFPLTNLNGFQVLFNGERK